MRTFVTLSVDKINAGRKLPNGVGVYTGTACRTGDMEAVAGNLGLHNTIRMNPETPVVLRHPDHMGSEDFAGWLVGLPVTLGHPGVRVTPENFMQYSEGFVVDSRGTGHSADVEMMIWGDKTLAKLESGEMDQLSLGYDTNFVTLGKNYFEPVNYMPNHLAVVEEGVCGCKCSIEKAHNTSEDRVRKYLDVYYN